jgi:hypothetical protein
MAYTEEQCIPEISKCPLDSTFGRQALLLGMPFCYSIGCHPTLWLFVSLESSSTSAQYVGLLKRIG